MGRGVYETNNKLKKGTLKYKQKEKLCLRVAKVEGKKYGTITGKMFLVFDYTGKKNFTIYTNKKEILNKSARIRKVTLSSSPWVEKLKLKKYGSVNL